VNIVHLIDSGGFYGAEVVLLNLVEEQNKLRHKVSIISVGETRAGEKAIEKIAKEKKITIIPLRFRNGPNILGSIQIYKTAKMHQADVIHSHGYKGDILMAMLPKWYRKIPVISTLHGWTATKKWTKMWVYERINILALKRLNGVVAVSQILANLKIFRSIGIFPEFIPNGLPELSFFEKPPLNIQLFNEINDKKVINILTIGRLSKEKGIDILIEALATLKNEEELFRLYVVGEGPLKKKLINLVQQLKIDDMVFFLGYQDDFYKYARFFDIYVISSYTEGLPMTLLEIMQSGIPIISTSVGEIPSVLKNGELGELVEPGDKEILAQGIRKIFSQYDVYRNKAKTSKKVAINEYSASKMANSYISLYNNIIHK